VKIASNSGRAEQIVDASGGGVFGNLIRLAMVE